MPTRRNRSGVLAIPIFALFIASCLIRLASLLEYRSSLPINHSGHYPLPDDFGRTLRSINSLSGLEKRVDDPPYTPPPPPPPLEPISHEAWSRKVTKGQSINCLFERPIEQVQQSKFAKWKDLADWGWVFGEGTSFFIDNKIPSDGLSYLETFFAKYPLPTKPWETEGLRVYNVEHKHNYKRPGSTDDQKHMGGEYNGWALIGDTDVTQYYIASEMYSPWYRGEMAGVKEMPELQRWSDVFALTWYHLQGGVDDGSSKNVRLPRYIVIPSLIRYKTDTQEAVIQACKITNQKLGDMPGGCEFEPDGETAEGYLGMLGTAHIQRIGFMLTQHKAWFGNKRIDKITAWIKPANTDNTIYNLLVSIADIVDVED